MCVAAIAWRAHPRWLLVAAGNRDEYHRRPAAPLSPWDSGIIAGRDLEAGGTWLGVAPGRFALVTNRRAEGYPKPGMASRGALVTDYLEGKPCGDGPAMNPFNLITAGPEGAHLLSNFPEYDRRELPSGIHTLSNGGLDELWFKEMQLAGALKRWLGTDGAPEELFKALGDPLPDPAQRDAPFSSVFIVNPDYGTRCSTVVAVDSEGRGLIVECSFNTAGTVTGTAQHRFNWSG